MRLKDYHLWTRILLETLKVYYEPGFLTPEEVNQKYPRACMFIHLRHSKQLGFYLKDEQNKWFKDVRS